MSEEQVSNINDLLATYEDAKTAAQAAREAFIASLPLASPEELKSLIVATRIEGERPDGLNQTFRVSSDQKTSAYEVTFTDESGEEVTKSLSIKTAKRDRKNALKDEKVRQGFEKKAASMELVSVKIRRNSKRETHTHKYVKEL